MHVCCPCRSARRLRPATHHQQPIKKAGPIEPCFPTPLLHRPQQPPSHLEGDLGRRGVRAGRRRHGVVGRVLAGRKAAGRHREGRAHRAGHGGGGPVGDLVDDGVDGDERGGGVVDADLPADDALVVDVDAGLLNAQRPRRVDRVAAEQHGRVGGRPRQVDALRKHPRRGAGLHAGGVDGGLADADLADGGGVAELGLEGQAVLDAPLGAGGG
jgi:hypothetical protein